MGASTVDAHLRSQTDLFSVRPKKSLLPTDRHCAHKSQRAMP
jgi:hypothetical protein